MLVQGTLAALDGNMNIALENTLEFSPTGEQKGDYGDAFIRGNNGNATANSCIDIILIWCLHVLILSNSLVSITIIVLYISTD